MTAENMTKSDGLLGANEGYKRVNETSCLLEASLIGQQQVLIEDLCRCALSTLQLRWEWV